MRRRPALARAPALLLTALLLAGGPPAQAQPLPDIDMVFAERPHYAFVETAADGSKHYKGLVLERVQELFRHAGLRMQLRAVPQRRRDAIISANASDSCALGVYKTPEREAFAQFSLPMHQDQPWPVISRAQAVAPIKQAGTLKELLTHTPLRAVFLAGLSHGKYVDGLIADMWPRPERTGDSPTGLLKMVEAGRVEFTILPMDVLEAYRAQQPAAKPSTLQATYLPDAEGQKVYVMCARRVPKAVLDRLNHAITAPDAPGTRRPGAP